MNYPIKTLSQLPLVLKGFRQLRGLTQAAMAEKLGITQQSYAYFEANPTTATLERFFVVLRMLDVEISLNPVASISIMSSIATDAMGKRITILKTLNQKTGKKSSVEAVNKTKSSDLKGQRTTMLKTLNQKVGKTVSAATIKKENPSVDIKPHRIASTTRKKESW